MYGRSFYLLFFLFYLLFSFCYLPSFLSHLFPFPPSYTDTQNLEHCRQRCQIHKSLSLSFSSAKFFGTAIRGDRCLPGRPGEAIGIYPTLLRVISTRFNAPFAPRRCRRAGPGGTNFLLFVQFPSTQLYPNVEKISRGGTFA